MICLLDTVSDPFRSSWDPKEDYINKVVHVYVQADEARVSLTSCIEQNNGEIVIGGF